MRNGFSQVISGLWQSGALAAYGWAALSPGVAVAQTGTARANPTIAAAPSDKKEPLTAGAASPAGTPQTAALQNDQPRSQSQPTNTGDVVVTGSRIVRDGTRAPTPTTVLSREELQQRNPTNIADYVQQLPSLGIGNSTRTTTLFANATGGANQLSARDLGVTRTLTLLDGRRVVGSGLSPAVDVNLLPQNLVSRVDVVTGGASAAYGSDAVAGVVNFILDTGFTGMRTSFTYSGTDQGGGRVVTGDVAAGRKIGERGHLLLSGLYYKGEKIDFYQYPRRWFQPGLRLLNNPDWTATNGQPGQIVRFDAGYNSTPGGVIASGPLRGTNFLPGGQIGQFVFGPIQQGQVQAGGTVESLPIRGALLPEDNHFSVYGRFAYELTDQVTAIVEGSYAGNDTINWSAVYNRQGGTAITINRSNPFIPLAIQQAMDANKITSFQLNRLFYDVVNRPDQHIGEAGYNRRTDRILAALEGKFGGSGRWHAYYQRGHSHVWYTRDNNIILSRFGLALDAIANPAVGGVAGVAPGTPICRSRLTAPTNGCVPLNVFGEGSLGKDAIAYVTGVQEGIRTRQDLSILQQVYSFDAQYEPFSTWAGPVSVAAGVEGRKESFTATADPLSIASAYAVGNFKPGGNSYTVREGFAETLVPLLRDSVVARSVDLNAAVRLTDYSTSGTVTTWKVGGTWDLDGQLRARITRSRDIRAPNLNDLFAPSSQFVNAYLDRTQTGSPQVPNITLSGGNPNLKPEIADTLTFGGVFTPRFLPGFSLSVDAYRINIKDAIVALGAQAVIDICYGFNRPQNSAACASIIKTPGATNLVNATILTSGVNAQNVSVAGIDYEMSYRTRLDRIVSSLPGSIDLRLLVSQRTKDETNLPGDTQPPTLGTFGSLKWRGLLTASYAVGPSRTTVTTRYLGPGKITNQPVTARLGIPDQYNNLPAVFYVELAQNLDVTVGGAKFTLFGVVENLFDKDPPLIPSSGTSFGSSAPYDLIGRSFRAGFRIRI